SLVAANARARNRSSSVVAPLSKVGWILVRSPVNGTVVSVFFGQPPRSDWWDRMFAAIRFPSSLANQSSGLLRCRAGQAADARLLRRTTASVGTSGKESVRMAHLQHQCRCRTDGLGVGFRGSGRQGATFDLWRPDPRADRGGQPQAPQPEKVPADTADSGRPDPARQLAP